MKNEVFLLSVFFSVTVISQAAAGALNCSSDEANDFFLKVPELVLFVSVLYKKTRADEQSGCSFLERRWTAGAAGMASLQQVLFYLGVTFPFSALSK